VVQRARTGQHPDVSGDRPKRLHAPLTEEAREAAAEHTAGIHQEDASERDLLATYVGEQAAESGETLTTPVGTWTGWDDTDDDHAWTTEVDDQTVLVFSSGDPDELRAFVQSLTTEPIAS